MNWSIKKSENDFEVVRLKQTEPPSFEEFMMNLDIYASPELAHKIATFQAISMRVEYERYLTTFKE